MRVDTEPNLELALWAFGARVHYTQSLEGSSLWGILPPPYGSRLATEPW